MQYRNDLEEKLIPKDEKGHVLFDEMDISDHQFVAYCLKAEVKSHAAPETIQDLTRYLVDHADENNDGEIGWGLEQEWDAFRDGSVNPPWHVYTIETINVMDAYLDALESGYLDDSLTRTVKAQLRDIAIIWNTKYWSEKGKQDQSCFYWYSISPRDCIACPNIDAKICGSQARLAACYPELLTEEELRLVYDHIDRCMLKIMKLSYLSDGQLIWNYLEKNKSQEKNANDLIHHAFILDGVEDYLKYRCGGNIPSNDVLMRAFVEHCIDDEGNLFSNPKHSSNRCFDTGAIRWLPNREWQQKAIIASFKEYANTDTDSRQMVFLLDAISEYLENSL